MVELAVLEALSAAVQAAAVMAAAETQRTRLEQVVALVELLVVSLAVSMVVVLLPFPDEAEAGVVA
ncbi:hypothetical protein [Brucella pituitosa]|uniref:hypothetical protein n=1 Tax=Brucella pituitosa TaxID=571256 RepID=UPI000C27B3E2|nr:hypothetical protein [Brucella pituitosa]PJO46104.1 hypothetical protein CWE02_12995 [Brucella pituitosa]